MTVVRFPSRSKRSVDPKMRNIALRTSFIARFIVLREGRRSRAHRAIEQLEWSNDSSAEEVILMIRQAFMLNGDKMEPVERDIRRAFDHANRSVDYFIEHYVDRATTSFSKALQDYQRSNELLFGSDEEELPRSGGWRLVDRMQNAADANRA